MTVTEFLRQHGHRYQTDRSVTGVEINDQRVFVLGGRARYTTIINEALSNARMGLKEIASKTIVRQGGWLIIT